MSGQTNHPLLTPRQAGMLLDDVIFTRVASLIDLPELYDLEVLLALQIESLGERRERARRTARTLIDRALVRLARTPRRWKLRGASRGANGESSEHEPRGSPAIGSRTIEDGFVRAGAEEGSGEETRGPARRPLERAKRSSGGA